MPPRKKPAAPKAAPATVAPADMVLLRCEDLGETRPFTPAHAERILAAQERQKLTGDSTWQPVAPAAADSSAPE